MNVASGDRTFSTIRFHRFRLFLLRKIRVIHSEIKDLLNDIINIKLLHFREAEVLFCFF